MRILIAILSTIAVAGCSMDSFDFKKTVTFDESDFGKAAAVDIDIDAGSIRVEETDTDDVLVSYEVRLSARDESTLGRIAKNVDLVGERNGDALTIRPPGLHKEARRRGRRDYHIVLKVPEGARVHARCLVGSISATGLTDPHLEGATGRVRLTEGTGAATLISQTGRVSLKDHRGTAACSTTTGAIDASFRAVEGEGEMTFTTVTGSITLAVPGDTSAAFDARTNAGSIDLPTRLRDEAGVKGIVGKTFAGTLNGGSKPITLRVKTGSVIIKTN